MQLPLSGQLIKVDVDLPLDKSSVDRKRICTGTTCMLSDSIASSGDAKERLASMRKLVMAVILCTIFMCVEVAAGVKANSLAILTDAAHLLSDVAAFSISLFSLWAGGWEATPRQSYGFLRIEILGALFSIQLIWVLAGVLVFEAVTRIIHDKGEVQGCVMFAVSAFGLVVNTIMAALLSNNHGHDHCHGWHSHGHGHTCHKHDHNHINDVKHSHFHSDSDHEHGNDVEHAHGDDQHASTHNHQLGRGNHKDAHVLQEPLLKNGRYKDDNPHSVCEVVQKKHRNINIDSAYLHALGDSIQSIGVMIGGAIIWYKPEWKIIDLICTLVFSVIVLATTVKLLQNILEVLMESAPREINAKGLEKGLCELHGVVSVHELHIWAITIGKVLLTCHVIITPEADADHVLEKIVDYIMRVHNISHVTVQIERQ
ncbi:hypothetical protein Taro_016058 [Colocasia esculenta]|uniref:Metal tolerance protein 1-like n=1 Tax=Colocasia esculenta TaxID=4460 RepID=A0A843UJ82_COLES|nr:hypothetical protein [Colocasia esculenta]